MSHESQLLRPQEAARHITMSLSFVYKQAAAGALPCLRIGRSLRFRKDALDAWLESQNGGGGVE